MIFNNIQIAEVKAKKIVKLNGSSFPLTLKNAFTISEKLKGLMVGKQQQYISFEKIPKKLENATYKNKEHKS
ncbi:hypothetical protein K4P04_09285 [Staphylococcus epidermidis]|nr:hypothetical protein [Staphylococcus epidermidis]MCG1058195.1 hypothetical protein [Staphylococcus epidermidis]MCG1123587.1 hypothetical protein [Staphylococcus epidermidis]MCG1198601.1 hypothetical protein [Staphylococcus epidermidis]MCG1256818.1 hypothetical protein [Staphylococcus epidermidis]MCG1259223.1 hypothetical protein [Staphylococcus epidermidis]